MRSIVAYLTTSDPTLKLYNAYKIRVTTDGGTLYNNLACTTSKITSLLSFVNTELDIYIPYVKRTALDSGVNYMPSSCMTNKIKTLNV